MRLVSIPIRLSIGHLTSSKGQWLALSRMLVQTALLNSINSVRLFRRPNRKISSFKTSIRFFQVIERNYIPWNFLFQIQWMPLLLIYRNREIIRAYFIFPKDYVLTLRHYVGIFFIIINFIVSLKGWLNFFPKVTHLQKLSPSTALVWSA